LSKGGFVRLSAALLAASLTAAAIGRAPSYRFDPGEASQGSIRFYAQAAQFRGEPGRTRVEISYVLPLENLQFLIADTAYQARYTLSVLLFDRSGRQAGGDSWERRLTVGDYASIGKEHLINADTLGLEMAPGRYRLKVVCTDNNSERQGMIERPLEVGDLFERPLALGGIRFERSLDGGFSPWAQKTYGGGLGPVSLYLRLYSAGPDTVVLGFRLEGMERGGGLLEASDTVAVDGVREIRRAIDPDSLPAGGYRLAVTAGLLSRPGQPFYQGVEEVRVQNPGSGGGEIESSLEVLRYVAGRKEIRQLERAAPGERDSLLEAFWRERDPTPGTVRNEARDDFYLRVAEANRKFSLGIRSGWRTDRGRIYIKYGPPDDIERHPFEPEYPSYEIWDYYADGVRFMFMDTHGYGDYRLMNPKAERK